MILCCKDRAKNIICKFFDVKKHFLSIKRQNTAHNRYLGRIKFICGGYGAGRFASVFGLRLAVLLFAEDGVLIKLIFGGCGGRALHEPPKITPLRGAVVRAAACGGPRVSFRERQRASAGARLRPAQSCGLHFRFGACCSPTAVGVRQQSAAVGRRRTARLFEPHTS